MKLSTTAAVLSLTLCVLGSPTPTEELEKRATCTIFGYQYWCAGTGASSTSAPVATGTPTSTQPPGTGATPTSNPGSGNGGSSRYTTGSTASDIASNSGCTELTVIFARGTTEGGNVGTIAGPPMFKQLLSTLGASSLTIQGVNYPASAAGNANCGAAGGENMAELANTILARCPSTKLVLSGYSQGACVVHNTVERQGLAANKVAATLLFGDPFNGRSVGSVASDKQLSICASGDSVCRTASGGASGSGHLSYGGDAKTAVDFITRAAGVSRK